MNRMSGFEQRTRHLLDVSKRLLRRPWKMMLRPLRIWKRKSQERLQRVVSSWDNRKTAIPFPLLKSIQDATYKYEFEGIQFIKNPFDLALYTQLLSKLRPGTIVEVGSWKGGSAKWLAAQIRGLELKSHVYSLDIDPVTHVSDEKITFEYGDIHALEKTSLPNVLSRRKGPLLVIEDGPHTYEGCLASLNFFHEFLQPGDYMVVEDGSLRYLGLFELKSGPTRAVKAFLEAHPTQYEIDYELCDFYGTNVTWNVDGYLRRVS